MATQIVFEYNGFTYEPWKDREEDNVKIFHDICYMDHAIAPMYTSPYRLATEDEFRAAVEGLVN